MVTGVDKYEFKLKIDEMKALVSARNYQAAAEIAETINWRKIRNLNALVLAGEVFEQVGRYEESKEILLMAYDKSPIGRNIIYRLAEIAIRTQRIDEAQEYYDEFVDIAPHDNLKYVLKYKMTAAQGRPYKEQIKILEELKEQEYSEEWAYELAYLYHKDMQPEKCVEACDELILWFGDGIYVEKALELKMHYQPLTKPQDEKYRMFRQKRTGVIEVKPNDFLESGEIIHEAVEIPYVQTNTGQFHTANLQEEIARGMQQISGGKMQQAYGQTQQQSRKNETQQQSWQNGQTQQQSQHNGQVQQQSWQNVQTQQQGQQNGQAQQQSWQNVQEKQWQDLQGQRPEEATGQEPAHTMTFEEIQAEWEKTKQAMQDALQEAEKPKTAESKEQSLEKAEQLMQRLLGIVPQLAGKMTDRHIEGQEDTGQEDQQSSNLQYDLDQAAKIVAGMNQLLQEQIDSLQAERRQTQPPEIHTVSDPTREMPRLPEDLLLGKEIGAIEKEEMDGSSLQNFSLEEEDNPVMNAWKEAPPGISAIDLLQRVRMEKNGVHFAQPQESPIEEPQQRPSGGTVPSEKMQSGTTPSENQSAGTTVPSENQSAGTVPSENPAVRTAAPQRLSAEGMRAESPEAQFVRPASQAAGIIQPVSQSAELVRSENLSAEPVHPAAQVGIIQPERLSAEEIQRAGIQEAERLEDTMQSAMPMTEPMTEESVAEEPVQTGHMAENLAQAGDLSAEMLQNEDLDWRVKQVDIPVGQPIQQAGNPNMENLQQMHPNKVNVEPEQQMWAERANAEPVHQMYPERANAEPIYQMYPERVNTEPVHQMYSETANTESVHQMYSETTNTEPVHQMYPETANAEPVHQMYSETANAEPVRQIYPGTANTEPVQQIYPDAANAEPVRQIYPDVTNAEPVRHTYPDTASAEPVRQMRPASTGEEQQVNRMQYIPQGNPVREPIQEPLKNKEMNAQPVYGNEQENLFLTARPRFLTQAQLQAESAMDGKGNTRTTKDFSSADVYENGRMPEGQNLEMMKILTPEQKQIFSYFVPIAGLEAQIYDLLKGVSEHLQYDKHALSGNIIIEGISGSGKTVLIMDIIKVLQKEIKRPTGKTGKIDANALNQKDLDVLMEKISGGCLIIESAGKISRETAVKLSRCMENDHTGTLYIMEDTAEGIQKALERDSSFAAKFTEKITIPLFSADELVEFGKAYANDLDYDIDEMGVLALYKRISSIQKLDHVTTLTEVKEIVDEAIENAERGVLKKVFGMLTSTRANDDNYVILREKDFEE